MKRSVILALFFISLATSATAQAPIWDFVYGFYNRELTEEDLNRLAPPKDAPVKASPDKRCASLTKQQQIETYGCDRP